MISKESGVKKRKRYLVGLFVGKTSLMNVFAERRCATKKCNRKSKIKITVSKKGGRNVTR